MNQSSSSGKFLLISEVEDSFAKKRETSLDAKVSARILGRFTRNIPKVLLETCNDKEELKRSINEGKWTLSISEPYLTVFEDKDDFIIVDTMNLTLNFSFKFGCQYFLIGEVEKIFRKFILFLPRVLVNADDVNPYIYKHTKTLLKNV